MDEAFRFPPFLDTRYWSEPSNDNTLSAGIPDLALQSSDQEALQNLADVTIDTGPRAIPVPASTRPTHSRQPSSDFYSSKTMESNGPGLRHNVRHAHRNDHTQDPDMSDERNIDYVRNRLRRQEARPQPEHDIDYALDQFSMQDPDNLLSREEREARWSLEDLSHPRYHSHHRNNNLTNDDDGDNFKDPADNAELPLDPSLPAIPRATSYDDKTFLNYFTPGNATLSYSGQDKGASFLQGLDLELIERRCPILGLSFEETRGGGMRFYADILEDATFIPFLRFLYLGTYAWDKMFDDVPTSLLLHCKMFRIGEVYDLGELRSLSHVNVMRQCHYGCSTPEKPIDLCRAIRFVYEHLREHKGLVDEILSYCVTCFLSHKLGEDDDFKKLACETRYFHQDLCQMVKERNFEDESATAIIQMSSGSFTPSFYLSREDVGPQRVQNKDYGFYHADVSPASKQQQAERRGKPEAKLSWSGVKNQGDSLPTTEASSAAVQPHASLNRSETLFGPTYPKNRESRLAFKLSEEDKKGLGKAVHDLAMQQVITTQEEADIAWLAGEDYLPLQEKQEHKREQEGQAEQSKAKPEPAPPLPTQQHPGATHFRKLPVRTAQKTRASALSAAIASDSEPEYEKVENPVTGHLTPDIFSDSEDDQLARVSRVRQTSAGYDTPTTPTRARIAGRDERDLSSGSEWEVV